ncbi:DUF294 nucleotidyltransferase-like domain-containing protein [Parendozoicomonas haliclonae]|uniref:Putative nucleotidyltransferase substrate binding domain protein n=1 Tax=Parendozoicomonas haliclonae TaxID=1960125 RepID=A0A1X7APF9_9GAMM|nr:DUF294 nucleotidyltransferase-like domain-containing protein [Parendozoicomonas haliclonae]SMA50033.1 putative nucleotidyltransferase substrate binding domain protein [Parendozoicomonas haliclonae]
MIATETRSTDYEARFHQPPFDRLTEDQRRQLIRRTSLCWYRPGEKLIQAGSEPLSLMVVQRGVIEERDAANHQAIYAHYAEDDLFDVRGVLEQQARHEYICLEEALIQEIPAELFRVFCQDNPQFEQGLKAGLGEKYDNLGVGDGSLRPAMAEFMLGVIGPEHCDPVHIIPAHTGLTDAARMLENQNLDALLVEGLDDGDISGLGMVTRTDLLRAVALEQMPLNTGVGLIAVKPLIHMNQGDYLFDALLTMTERHIERVVIYKPSSGELVGLLSLNRILSLASSHSHLLAMRIARAETLPELIALSPDIEKQARSLFENGVRTGFVMKLVSTLNDKLLRRLFELHFPKEWHAQLCLLALGSEGRGEQVIKTDQDNALIVKDGSSLPPQSLLDSFTQLLIQCGWPRCEGEVMVCNPHWVQSQSGWHGRIQRWMDQSTPQAMMEMAMMVDARCVAGNAELLDDFHRVLDESLGRREAFLSTFVAPALGFDTRLTFFGRIKAGKDHRMDIKKAGIFPVVHGVRTLALEHRLRELSTVERLSALKAKGKIDAELASKLEEAFLVLNRLRLEQQVSGVCDGNALDLDALDYRRRDMLRHCLHTVKKFHQFLQRHFHVG